MGAYCRTRQRQPVGMVSTLSGQVGRMMAEEAPQEWQWRGRPVRLVDGTMIWAKRSPYRVDQATLDESGAI